MRFFALLTLACGASAAVVRQATDSASASDTTAIDTTVAADTTAVDITTTESAAATESVPTESLSAEAEAACQTIAEILADNSNATLISALVTELNLTARFNSTKRENLTVFLPTDEALLGADLPKNPTDLFLLLSYHVVPGIHMAADLKDGDKLEPFLLGSTLPVHVSADGVKVQNSTVTQADIVACNGVIHIIDKPLTATGHWIVDKKPEGTGSETAEPTATDATAEDTAAPSDTGSASEPAATESSSSSA